MATKAREKPRVKVDGEAPALDRHTMSGFCAYPAPGSHGYCDQKLVPAGKPCTCPCHDAATPPSIEGFGENLTGFSVPKHRLDPPTGKHAAEVFEAALPSAESGRTGKLAEATVTVDLPPVFYNDHVGRDLPAGEHVKTLRWYERVKLNREAYDDLLADAQQYSEGGAAEYPDNPREVSSARWTVAALKKAGRP
jgi:hypothetical protein